MVYRSVITILINKTIIIIINNKYETNIKQL